MVTLPPPGWLSCSCKTANRPNSRVNSWKSPLLSALQCLGRPGGGGGAPGPRRGGDGRLHRPPASRVPGGSGRGPVRPLGVPIPTRPDVPRHRIASPRCARGPCSNSSRSSLTPPGRSPPRTSPPSQPASASWIRVDSRLGGPRGTGPFLPLARASAQCPLISVEGEGAPMLGRWERRCGSRPGSCANARRRGDARPLRPMARCHAALPPRAAPPPMCDRFPGRNARIF